MSWRKKFLDKHGTDKMLAEFDISFTPETPEEKEEAARQEICNLMDDPSWRWLKSQINDQHLCWPEIMRLVQAHLEQ